MPARVRWRTAPPTSIDERLDVADDGTATLSALRPRTERGSVGVYRARIDGADLASLLSAGEVVVDLPRAVTDADLVDVLAAADRVVATVRRSPHAVVTFYCGASSRGVTLGVIAAGAAVLPFEVDPAASAVHFTAPDGQPVGWQPFPDLSTGFVTPDAEGLGGVRRRAHVPPGSYGALVFDVPIPPGASGVAIEVIGWLHEVPGEPMPVEFAARTDPRPLG